MEKYLTLIQRYLTDTGEYYDFDAGGRYCRLDRLDSINLIKQYPSQCRNCKTDGNSISMKQGYGNVPIVEAYSDYKLKLDKMPYTREDILINKNGVNIYIGKKYKKQCFVYENDTYFLIVCNNLKFLKQNEKYLAAIDKAKIINDTPIKVETPYGICDITEISTGLKTVLNIRYIKSITKKPLLVCIDDCGDNVIPYLFSAVTGTNIGLYLSHAIFTIPDNFAVYVNNSKLNSVRDDLYDIFDKEGLF